jgi:hypothetical protein
MQETSLEHGDQGVDFGYGKCAARHEKQER